MDCPAIKVVSIASVLAGVLNSELSVMAPTAGTAVPSVTVNEAPDQP
jgi:hypothetical protein